MCRPHSTVWIRPFRCLVHPHTPLCKSKVMGMINVQGARCKVIKLNRYPTDLIPYPFTWTRPQFLRYNNYFKIWPRKINGQVYMWDQSLCHIVDPAANKCIFFSISVTGINLENTLPYFWKILTKKPKEGLQWKTCKMWLSDKHDQRI